MKSKWLLLFAMVMLLATGLALTACGGGGDDDDDDRTDDDDDNDDATDDDDDDTTDDDDVTDDDDDDDTTDDDDDDDDVVFTPVYDSLRCAVPDPEGLGEGMTIGGGAIAGTVTAYVYEDLDGNDDGMCDAIAGADVNGETTDADGMAVVTISKAAELIVAKAADHWSWAYQADSAVMYFLLRADKSNIFADSATGEFKDGGTPLPYDNIIVGINNVLTAKIYLGAVVPGLARTSILSLDDAGLLPTATFPLGYETIGFDAATQDFTLEVGSVDLPSNIYLPELDLDATLTIPFVGTYGVTAAGINEQYVLPVMTGATEMALEGFVASIDIGGVVDMSTLIGIVVEILGGGDIMEVVLGLIEPVINDGLAFEHHGVVPDWNASGAPDIAVEPLAESGDTLGVTVAGADKASGYLSILAGEVGNRALWPMGMKIGEDVEFGVSSLDDTDYILLSAKTNVLDILAGSVAAEDIELTIAAKYADELADWGGDVSFGADDFLPAFDTDNTSYDDTTGVVTWAFPAKADLDLFMVAVLPDGGEVGLAVLPGDATMFDAVGAFDFVPGVDDVIVVIGMDLPNSVDINAFDPTSIVGYNAKAINLWTNYPIDELLEGLLP